MVASCTYGVPGCNPATCNGHLGQAKRLYSEEADIKKLARQVNMDIAQFRSAAIVLESVLTSEGVHAVVVGGQLTDFVKCASAMDDSAEKLASEVIAHGI